MKRYVKAAELAGDIRQFCSDLEQELIDGLSANLTTYTVSQISVSVMPAGSGIRVVVQLPTKAFHGKTFSEYCYRRDANRTVADMIKAVSEYVMDRQEELLKPTRKSSTAEAVKEGRNSTDPERLRQLASHNAKSVRDAVVKNPNTPPDIVLDLYESDPYRDNVYRGYGRSINWSRIPIDMLVEYHYKHPDDLAMFNRIMGSSRTPEHVIRELFDEAAQHVDEFTSPLFYLVTNRTDLPEDIYYDLAELDADDIDWNLVVNPGVPMDLVKSLRDRHSGDSRFEARIQDRRYYR